jgi:hypothetical protein
MITKIADNSKNDKTMKTKNYKALYEKQKELIANFENYLSNPSLYQKNKIKIESELAALEAEEDKPEIYKPYFGWCDVSRCKNEGCSGGVAWKETGHWTVCYKHSASAKNGDPQPKMKQSAIKREKSRDKVTGYLPITNK